MYQPTLETAKTYTEQYKMIPVSRTLLADRKTPIEVLQILKTISKHCYLLESLEDSGNRGRYTFLGYDPKMEITCTDGIVTVTQGTDRKQYQEMPAKRIQSILEEYQSPRFSELPPFTGGLVGYFSYEFIKYSEPSLMFDCEDEENFCDVDLMLFDKVIAFDHLKQTITLIVNIPTHELETNYDKAKSELQAMVELFKLPTPTEDKPFCLKSDLQRLFDENAYCAMVEKAKKYIYEGDIFQVVLSNRLEAEAEGSLLDVYRILRITNPSPYLFYFSSDALELVGSSPETLVKLQEGRVYTYPLAGTRPRGKTLEEDIQLEKELMADEKELAEHNMLVDLGRNDLGKISEFGSVFVEDYQKVVRFSHVMHIASTVTGVLRKDMTPIDAIGAVLPAGTLSGAPKIRACEIIQELEQNKRGIYGGAVGYIDFTGNMDTCIAIRMAFKKNGKVFIRSGAGIVADSIPQKEYQECIQKAQAVVQALKMADGGMEL